MTAIKPLVIEGSWIVIGQILSVAGALLLVRVLTEHLPPAQFGQLALGLTVAGLVNQVVMGGITAGIGRFYSIAAEKRDLGGYLYASLRIMGYATGAVLIAGLILITGTLSLGYSQWVGLAVSAIVFSILSGYNGALSGVQNAARQRAIVALHSGMDAWLKILLALCMALWLGTSSTAVIVGYAFSSLLTTASQLFFLRSTIGPQKTQAANRQVWMPQIWAYSLPFTTWGAFTWIQQSSDRWALEFFANTTDVGQYAVLFQLGYTPIALFTGMAVNFLGPILFQLSGDATDPVRNASAHHLSWRMTHIALLVTMLGFAVTFSFHEHLFGFLVAAEYRGESYLLPWFVLAGGLFACGQVLALKLMSEMKSTEMTAAKIITALIGSMLNVFGAAIAGIHGVVAALVAFSGIYLVWMAVLARRSRLNTGSK